MSIEVLRRRFNEIGAQVKVTPQRRPGVPQIDVSGSWFDIRLGRGDDPGELEVVDVRPEERHLLLLVRRGEEKSKFLCGFDERHWFVAAIPESERGVSGVAAAKAALQPDALRGSLDGVRPKDRLRRRNAAFIRQGEWFFVPTPDLRVDAGEVLRKEPLARSGGTPHGLELAVRRGGRTVYVHPGHARSLSPAEFARLKRPRGWRAMTADPELYAKGAVRHPDHATVVLRSWHRVLMNTELRAEAMRFVTFVD